MSEPISYSGLIETDRQDLSKRGLLKSQVTLSEANTLLKEIFKLGNYETVDLMTSEKKRSCSLANSSCSQS